jgi:hypothetical protein
MNLHIKNLESFPWIALHGLLQEMGEVNADIVLESGQTYQTALIEHAENETLHLSGSFAFNENISGATWSAALTRIPQSEIRTITIN